MKMMLLSLGLATVALSSVTLPLTVQAQEPSAVCEFGDSRGPHCYMGEMTFCRGVKRSTLFPSLIECGDSRRFCSPRECKPSFVDEKGKVVVYDYDKFTELGEDLVVGQSAKGFAALYTRSGVNLIRSGTHLWRCTGLKMIDDQSVECVGERPGIFKVSDLKAFRESTLAVKDVVRHSALDVCAASREEGEGLLQFWANRFRIGEIKYAIHLKRLESGARVCQFQVASGPECYRLLVDEKGVLCRHHGGETRVLEKELSLEMRTNNFRSWSDRDKTVYSAKDIEDAEDQGLILVTDRDGLIRSRSR